MGIKEKAKNGLKAVGMFDIAKRIYYEIKRKKNLTNNYIFEDRKQDKEKVCFILAGYKSFLYEAVFGRIKKFIPNDIEVCILSSGKYDGKLSIIAKENNWSYLSIKRNNVSLAQNVGINLFKNAKYIYKLDEDIFVTENYFDILFKTFKDCESNGKYRIGFVAPTIPINGFGNYIVLDRFDLLKVYEEKFEKPLHETGPHRMVENNPEVAKFFWGNGGYVPSIDEMNEKMNQDEFCYTDCPIKFSIGAILFEREFWENMRMLTVSGGAGVGGDEIQICKYCTLQSRAMIISKNAVVRSFIIW